MPSFLAKFLSKKALTPVLGKAAKELLQFVIRKLPWEIWLERLWSRIVAMGLRKLASYKTNLYTDEDVENDLASIRGRSTDLKVEFPHIWGESEVTLPKVK